MFVDARSIPSGTVLETDLCVVGAGAAGITLAREFAGAGIRVALLEGGATEFEPDSQELYQAASIGRPFLDPTTCRLRYFGGTTNHWGGWCMPRDPIDFEARDGIPYSGWPFDRHTLDPWYARAQKILELGPYDYDAFDWGIARDQVPSPFGGPHFTLRMLQCSPPTRFGAVYGPALRASGCVSVYLHANALGFESDQAGRQVRSLKVAGPSGAPLEIRARAYVLSCGGIENARMLLLSGPAGAGLHDVGGLGNANDLVGRFFMVHPIYAAGTIAVADPHMDFRFYTNTTSDGIVYPPFGQRFATYLGLTDDAMRARSLPNTKIIWDFVYEPEMAGIEAFRRLSNESVGAFSASDVKAVMRDLGGVGGFLYRKARTRSPFPVAALKVQFSSEQLPNPDSRITLGDERDRLGLRRAAIDWRLSADDRRAALTTQRLLAAEIGRAGLGRMQLSSEDETDWPDDLYGDEHHMGATRMHPDPRQGVVDADCRVHGVANLYVAGSSVFPTAGAANPTMTIVALSLRLADHLKGLLA